MNTHTSPLAQACGALWLATLALMTAYMRTPAPAHRHLLARRVAANLRTLAGQECFTADARAVFQRLSTRWDAHAARVAPQQGGETGFKWVSLLKPR